MKKITDQIENKTNLEEEYVVNGEGCLDDCPHHYSWMWENLGCGWRYTAFITEHL